MNSLFIQQLDFAISSETLFERIRDLSHAVFLDSNAEHSSGGRFDIISAVPSRTIVTIGQVTRVEHFTDSLGSTSPVKFDEYHDCPFTVLRRQLQDYPPTLATLVDLPFKGGALGYFGYDLGRRLEKLPRAAVADIDLPEMNLGIYDWALIKDHQKQRSYFVARPECSNEKRDDLLERLNRAKPFTDIDFSLTADFKSNLSYVEYKERYQRIIGYIQAGDCYQVNLTQRFQACYQGDEWFAYKQLRRNTDAPFSAYLQFDGGADTGDGRSVNRQAVLSLSPERFISVTGNRVETKPIKGTRPRSDDKSKDLQNAQLLRNSVKDRAENLMIVDLLRNDLGKSCRTGSVTVPSLFEIEAFSNVYHLVSTIQGALDYNKDSIELLRGCFPGGSITGAPKLRAMEIIEELEPQRRSLYCGSIGYISFDGNMDTNIAIRTLLCHGNEVFCWAGGAIVADSDVDEEYRESHTKVNHLLEQLSKQDPSAANTAELSSSQGNAKL